MFSSIFLNPFILFGNNIPTSITIEGTWSTQPNQPDNARDRNLSTFTSSTEGGGIVLNGNTNQNQIIKADFGSSKTFAYTVKYKHRQNGAGSDATTYYVEDSTDNVNWTTRDTNINTTNDVFIDKTVNVSSTTFRYIRIRMNTNNTGRVRYLDAYEFYQTGSL